MSLRCSLHPPAKADSWGVCWVSELGWLKRGVDECQCYFKSGKKDGKWSTVKSLGLWGDIQAEGDSSVKVILIYWQSVTAEQVEIC